MTEKSRARYDGAAQWTTVDTEFMATRTDSIFLKMLVKKYWHLPVETDISNNAGLIMLPQDKNLGSIIGPKGKYVNDLKEICGLSRIVVVRRSERRRPDMRLISAVKQIVGLDSVQVRPPLAGAEEWRLKVSTREAPVLVGSGGTNLRFISVLTGLRIKLFVRDGR
jgi:transcription antitermination factor NusA-like protein